MRKLRCKSNETIAEGKITSWRRKTAERNDSTLWHIGNGAPHKEKILKKRWKRVGKDMRVQREERRNTDKKS